MKLEDQVCSLELAKKLKELGVKQKSLFWYYEYHGVSHIRYYTEDSQISGEVPYAAFTVAELGEMLPVSDIQYEKRIRLGKIYWVVTNWDLEEDKQLLPTEIKEADARAEMLIHLIENKLIDITEDQ